MSPQNPAIDPRRTALLIMDYQPAVLGSLDDHDHLLTLASGAIGLARQAGITVAYVRVAFADEDYETDVEEVGVSRMEGIAASLKNNFSSLPRPEEFWSPPLSEEKAPTKKTVRRRWFR
jgi:nicotinamidase-related amidase